MKHNTRKHFGFAHLTIQNLKSQIQHLNWPLLLLILIGIALRLWMIGVSPLDPRFSNADDGDYYRRALRLAVTGQYIDDAWLIRPPLHVFFFAFWLRLALAAGRPELGVLLIQLAQTAMGALTILLGFACARRLFSSPRAGLLFASFLALWYPFVEQPSGTYSEPLYLFLFLLHLWLLLRFDASGRRRDLALAGLALGAAALTRSPALYSLAFVALWLIVRHLRRSTTDHRPPTTEDSGVAASESRSSILHPPSSTGISSRLSAVGRQWSVVGGQILLVSACCLAVVGPWTARNYLTYQRFIPVDTLGPINLWLDLDETSRRNLHIAELSRLPQADRQSYATARVREILAVDPLRPFRQIWPTFRHIWKAQYIEDFFVKQSFFTRPLRTTAPLGLPGDLIWLVYTLAGLVGLAAPPREGLHHRLFLLAWLGYSLLTVLIFHVEPRYLIPLWTLIGLYGAGALARIRRPTTANRQPTTPSTSLRAGDDRRLEPVTRSPAHPLTRSRWWSVVRGRWSVVVQSALVITFLALFVTYRDYPAFIARGLERERAAAAGQRAYIAGDYAAAERAYRAALATQPDFVDTRIDLALALAAQGRRNEATGLLASGGSRRAELVAGALARDAGDPAAARETLERIEGIAGEDVQQWTLDWLRPPSTTALTLGDGLDLGYIAGFSGGERAPTGSFRWLEGTGRIVLPLPAPLQPDATLLLRMSGGRPGATSLDIRIGQHRLRPIPVQGGQWRVYRLPIPPELAGQHQIAIELRAPTFVPALNDPSSDDARALSLMIGEVRIE